MERDRYTMPIRLSCEVSWSLSQLRQGARPHSRYRGSTVRCYHHTRCRWSAPSRAYTRVHRSDMISSITDDQTIMEPHGSSVWLRDGFIDCSTWYLSSDWSQERRTTVSYREMWQSHISDSGKRIVCIAVSSTGWDTLDMHSYSMRVSVSHERRAMGTSNSSVSLCTILWDSLSSHSSWWERSGSLSQLSPLSWLS